ncbi:NarK family nitrate/nitrite MFS transporter [Desertibacillus haloalkaliphilus]|uniref:NarK family nitrate/nitrite MFS transporter n=1 Tax=Desertibacillus haloalkaliphilus TaxID=1328930 RepID=UPI001C252C60|nr:NarK family nitrate/nitrite MFS transporter [Desertibacillus haloalkaliphilus]MBU8907799.1 NarK family nitrate/nitrite MFS transporter [Desertibacillus haloalkaliphilus]
MTLSDVFKFKNQQTKMLHLAWIAFFVSFFTWFNMAPLATTMIETTDFLTADHLAALAIVNVALTIPARIIVGKLLDKYGPRKVYAGLLIIMSIPTFVFAFGTSFMQLLIARLILSSIGASFVVGIRMVSEWFPPRSVGMAEGIYGGWGNFGSAAGAMLLPWLSLTMFGGDNGWRYAVAFTGLVCLIYGIIFYIFARDTPEGKEYKKPKKIAAMEVSSWGDMVLLILWTIPLYAALTLVAWRLQGTGMISDTLLYTAYALCVIFCIYQIYNIFKVNVPILKKGVPKDDRYKFRNVAALNSTYFANFGAELAIISMLPMFFQMMFSLSPAQAGLIASSFAFVNLIARPLGGWLSDRMNSRRNTMLIYMIGISVGLVGMGMIDSSWPLVLAVAMTIVTSMFIQGAEGATFAVIPFVKQRITGQIAGMSGAYGNVGSTVYLVLYTLVTPQQFFFILAGGAFLSFICCYFWLDEPEGSFANEYLESSVDRSNQYSA